jgi:hypothetical protein
MSGGPGNWWGYEKVDKVLCASDGPPATYAWSVSPGRVFTDDYNTRYLHLRAVDEPCGDRRRLLEGVWDEILD